MSRSVPDRDDAPAPPAPQAARPDDAELVRRLRAGDAAAFEAVFRAHYVPLCTFVSVHTGSLAVAEELVQDVFASLWERRDRLELRSTLRAYLHGAARKRALSHVARDRVERRWAERVLQREHDAPAAAHAAAADGDLWSEELRAVVRAILERMPERRRLTYMLSRDRHMSYAEIAEALGVSIKTVEVQIGRALRDLRDGLAAAGWIDP